MTPSSDLGRSIQKLQKTLSRATSFETIDRCTANVAHVGLIVTSALEVAFVESMAPVELIAR